MNYNIVNKCTLKVKISASLAKSHHHEKYILQNMNHNIQIINEKSKKNVIVFYVDSLSDG